MRKCCLLLVFSVVFLIGQVSAQVITADVSGIVYETENAPLPGVSVTLQNSETGFERSTTSNESGRYFFRSIPTQGIFTISVEISGFQKQIRSGLVFHSNQKAFQK